MNDEERAVIELSTATLELARDTVDRLLKQRDALLAAIEEHRSQRGDDRCWMDDQKLYEAAFGPGQQDYGMPPREAFLESCAHYYDKRCTK